MGAGLTKSDAFTEYIANIESVTDKMVQRDVTRRNVSTVIGE
jgi:hypothetical protein